MRKFTVFTLILTVVVVVVVADLLVNEYATNFEKGDDNLLGTSLPFPDMMSSDDGYTANVLGADAGYESVEVNLEEVTIIEDLPIPASLLPPTTGEVSGESDFEDQNFVSFTQNVLIREDQVRSAGFANAYLESEPHNGYLFKTIYLDDLNDTEANKYIIKNNETPVAKVYTFQFGPLSNVDSVYSILKTRATEGLDIEINETNTFGEASFYMNDSRRQNVAFLAVKVGGVVYGFSYPKEYHPQVTNLVKLIDLEF